MEVCKIDLAGRPFSMETGHLARQAHGAVLVRYGGTQVLVAATVSKAPREGIDFFPLTVDYEERLYAVGRIPGGFIKREGRPTERAILAARLIDRPLRPLFPKDFRNSVHVVNTVFSVDQDCSQEIAAINGASAALTISKIPFGGPVGAVLVGYKDGRFILNPTAEENQGSLLHLYVAGTREGVMMVEAGALEVSREILQDAILFAHEEIKKLVDLQEELAGRLGVVKMEYPREEPDEEMVKAVEDFTRDKMAAVIGIKDKAEREDRVDQVKDEALLHFGERYPEKEKKIKDLAEGVLKGEVRKKIVEEGLRPDGREPGEIRTITSEVAFLSRVHGSGLFTRGQTQVLTVCTLGALGDVQILDGLGLEEFKKFMHHYNFPPFSVGESGFIRGPGRREIGHGALAERAIIPVLPSDEEFPYTVRLVSEILESNGSTSMGSVCASSLALMDAGVPVKGTVAGIAMGLIKEGEDYAILSDIQGMEDFLGDMDFKVAGTREGITALQMDIKIAGLDREILEKSLAQAVDGYLYIMDRMEEVISQPRPDLSPYAPKIFTMQISPDKIRDVIGPGGKIINKIVAETGVKIDIEPDGKIYIAAVDQEGGNRAREMIEQLTAQVEPGKVYLGRVTRVEKYGAFVEVLPGKEGLVHISQLGIDRVGKTEDVVNVGDELKVKALDIDDRGRINLSHKAVLHEAAGTSPRDDRPGDRRPARPQRRPRPQNK